RTVGRLFGAGGSLAGTTVAAMAGPSAERQSPDVVPADLVRRIRAAAVDVEDVFSQYLSEPHQSHSPVMEWARVVADAHRLWFGAATASVAPRLVSGRLPPSGRSLVEQAGAVLEEDYRRVDLWLTEGSSLKLDPLPRLVYGDTAPRGAGGEGDRATLRLLEIETWIDELAAGPDELGPLVTQLGESEKAAAMVPAATAG
ncbi:MAG TPA: hypothetical protein VKW77_06525, partial [Acidimicrobiales bacterium]|nr:hypothetical protein [Acidimicrobiales bacterium]